MNKLLEKIKNTEFRLTTVGGLVCDGLIFEPIDGNHGEIHPKSEDYVSEGIPFVMASDITDSGDLDLTKTKFISEEQANKLRKGFSINGDILLSHKATIGRVAEVHTDKDFVMLTPQITYYRVKNDKKLIPRYLKYYFKTPFFQNTIKSFAGSGSTRAYIGIQAQHDLPIKLPDLPTQKKIASILSAYDSKIENNNKIIKNLELTAQTIFNQWFANFKFPGYEKVKMVDSETGEIPEGWRVESVMDVIDRIPVGKKYDNKSALPNGKVPILDQGASGFIGYHNDEAGINASLDNPVVVFTNHTCYYRLLTEPFSCIQNVLPYIGKNGYSTLFVYFLTKEKIKMSEYKGHWPEFEQQMFPIPPVELANSFASKVQGFIKESVLLEKENIKLKESRDQLLAKLI